MAQETEEKKIMDVRVLRMRQGLTLDDKIGLTTRRIHEWQLRNYDKTYVAFSGGKDSTVMLHLVRSLYPDTEAVFCDTGLEFPEVRDFVKTIDNVRWLKPKMTFKKTIDHYGFPIISKRMAQYIHEVKQTKSEHLRKLRTTGIRKDGTFSPMAMISKKWQYLIDAPFGISDKCCKIMKKDISADYAKETGNKAYVGTMASDGQQREKTYLQFGCNAFDLKTPRSTPLSFWMEEDIWEYMSRFNVPYSSIYDLGYPRTGCAFCCFGVHLEKQPNRFQRMKKTHPKLWEYCIHKLKVGEMLDYINVPYGDYEEQTTLFEEGDSHGDAEDTRRGPVPQQEQEG